MNTYFPRRWHVMLATAVALAALGMLVTPPRTGFAAAGGRLGRDVTQTHYGVWGNITGWTDPYASEFGVSYLGTYELLMSTRSSGTGLIEIGLVERADCPGTQKVAVYSGWLAAGGSGGWACNTGFSTNTQLPYVNEYDVAGNYWCLRANGTLLSCRSLSWGDITSPAGHLYAYGMTGDSAIQMGGADAALKVSLQNILYKPAPNTSWGLWTVESSSGVAYNSCASPCQYQYQYGVSSGLYTRNWSDPLSWSTFSTGIAEVEDITVHDRWQHWNYVYYTHNTAYAVRLQKTSQYFRVTDLVGMNEGWAGNWVEDGHEHKSYNNPLGSAFWPGGASSLIQGATYSWTWNYNAPTGDALVKGQGDAMFVRTISSPGFPDLSVALLADVLFGGTQVCLTWAPGGALDLITGTSTC